MYVYWEGSPSFWLPLDQCLTETDLSTSVYVRTTGGVVLLHIPGHCPPKTDLTGRGKSQESAVLTSSLDAFCCKWSGSRSSSTTIVLVHYPSFAPRTAVISIVSRFIEFSIWNQGGWLLSMLKKNKNQSNMVTREINLNEWMFSKQKNFTSLPCIWRYIH